MTYRFVTSMSKEGYEQYGRNFLDSFLEKCAPRLSIHVFSEDDLESDSEWIHGIWRLLEEPGLPDFLSACPIPESPHYQWQAGRFAKKIFAISSDKLPKDGWRIWLDADVIVDKPFTVEFLRFVCPFVPLQANYIGSYLGRKDWHHSECGWVAYNLENGGLDFLREFREMYTSGEIFEYLEWHDSYLFDRLRERRPENWFNISADIPGMHPWDETILGEYMRHLKGPLRKKGKSGNVPADYWSEKEQNAV